MRGPISNRPGLAARLAAAGVIFLSGLAAANADTIKVGTSSSSSDVPFYIGIEKGYFKQEGLDVKLLPFGSASKMVAPLGSGDLDVGAGASSAGLFNAYSRGVHVKIVADKGSIPVGYGYQALLVRKDLVASGRYKSLKDLKGMRIASNGVGNASTASLNAFLEKGGLKLTDAHLVLIDFPQHIAGLTNKAVDASITTEPTVTEAVKRGLAVRIGGDDMVYPNHQLAVLLYGAEFIRKHPDDAKKFMKAYIKSVRYYNDALRNGHLAGPNANDVINILTRYTAIKDPNVYRTVIMQANNPNGHVNVDSIKKDYAFFKEYKYLTGTARVEDLVDMSFADAAVKELGPYKPKR